MLETVRAQRQAAVRELAEALVAGAHATGDPAVLRRLAAFWHRTLDLTSLAGDRPEATALVVAQARDVTRMGLTLPPVPQCDYWERLVERHGTFWDPTLLPAKGSLAEFRNWLHDAQARHVSPLRALLAASCDRETVALALDLGVAQPLAAQEWADPDLYRLFVTLARELGLTGPDYFVRCLCRVVTTFPDARAARPYFQALLQPLRPLPPARRRDVLEVLWDEAGYTRQAVRQRLPRVLPLLPALARFGPHRDRDWCACGPVFAAALELAEAVPEQASARLETLLSVVTAWQDRTFERSLSVRTGLTLAVALTAQDADRFAEAVRAATRHDFRQEREHVSDGLRRLARVPGARWALGHLFPAQPQRIADLLVRLGLTARLGMDVQPLLDRLEPQGAGARDGTTAFPILLHPDRAWWDLHQRMPALTPAANAYRHAQWLWGGPPDIPPGARRALERPRRTAAELAHLTQTLAAAPERTDLAARAAAHRALLADPARLEAEVAAEVGARLPQVAAQALAEATERQVLACYRARLEAVAGPQPPDLVLTDDLINAILLTVDIAQNRKLLLQLLRAHLAGDADWRERHPANRAFLDALAGRAVDVVTWLSAFPRLVRCASVPGGKIHLRLERDPLAVLQMGNLFDTCLSFGGLNAFSTVANACELNKRVVYARDAAGHVLGRKLIGLGESGDLVGFHTYCALTGDAENDALRDIIRRYAASFAARCGLRLADAGTVPTLFAEAWYDDGAVPWDARERPQNPPPPMTRRPAGTCRPTSEIPGARSNFLRVGRRHRSWKPARRLRGRAAGGRRAGGPRPRGGG